MTWHPYLPSLQVVRLKAYHPKVIMSPLLLALVQLLPIALCLSTTQPTFTAAELSHEVVTFDKRAAAASASPLNRQLLGLSIEFVLLFQAQRYTH